MNIVFSEGSMCELKPFKTCDGTTNYSIICFEAVVGVFNFDPLARRWTFHLLNNDIGVTQGYISKAWDLLIGELSKGIKYDNKPYTRPIKSGSIS